MKINWNTWLFPLLIPVVLLHGCNRQGNKSQLINDSPGEDGWESLYNGGNLEGWHVESRPEDRNRNYWQDKGEYVECNSLGQPGHGYVWLISDNEYNDFHLRLEFQIFKTTEGNSGLQFRSRYDTSDMESGSGWLNGPQVDIHPPSPLRTGLIYDETRGVQRWIYPSLPDWEMVHDSAPRTAHQTILRYADDDPEAWNSLELICTGMEILTLINGHLVTSMNAAGILDDQNHQKYRVGTEGHFALQLHTGDEILIRFRNIYIRKISEQ